ncbi:MAG: c-type cytochrome [Alphaproteobacteria bacterium]|nr:c-type cytochrome [Alphaproteobacteria bacterium]
MRMRLAAIALMLAGLAGQALAESAPEGGAEGGLSAEQFVGDPLDGEDVFIVCAPCHGDAGQGGGGGLYPRIAGMSMEYLVQQLRDFKSRARVNIPMYPYTTEREMSDQDIIDVALYVNAIVLQTYLPPLEEGERMDGLARLNMAKKVLQIPRAESGDMERGRGLYADGCASCHGDQGEGRPHDPLLSGQHLKYLKTQFDLMKAGAREHPRAERLIQPLSEADVTDLLAYISILDDPPH